MMANRPRPLRSKTSWPIKSTSSPASPTDCLYPLRRLVV
ncbi:hypothetical protein DFAR_940017 [Desulfarculales bacterium]